MKRFILFFSFLFCFPTYSHAEYTFYATYSNEDGDEALRRCQYAGNFYMDRGSLTSFYCTFYRVQGDDIQYNLMTSNQSDETPVLGETVYGIAMTDEQCSSVYSGSYSLSFAASELGSSSVPAGACNIIPSSGDQSGAVCTDLDGDEIYSCYSDWESVSSGEINVLEFDDSSSFPTGGDSGVDQSDDVPEYLTETDDPASCTSGSLSAGGVSYCVDTSSVSVTDLSGSAWTGGSSGDGDGDGDSDGDGSGDGEGDTDGQCDPETDGECEGESTECLPGMSCYVPTDAQVEAKFFDYFPGSVDNTQVTEYDASDFELDGEYETGLTSGSCPAPVPVTLALGGNSHTFEITFEFFCQFALLIRGLVLASCSFLAANIIYRGVVTLV